MKLKFAKMHGLGNDFMVVDAINQNFKPRAEQVKGWSNRLLGIGFDQLLVIEKATTANANFKYRIFNADGGEVAQCGNGARCFARFAREQGLTDLDSIIVETNTGLLTLEVVDETRYRVNMGQPMFEPNQIPLRADHRENIYSVEEEDEEYLFSSMSIGNPHMVLQVDDVDLAPVNKLGPRFEQHLMFPERANIGFMQVLDRSHFKLRVHERGVGETKACGSGACAAMVAGVQLNLLDPHATAVLLGGDLNLEWQGESNPVMMTGDTAMVYQGQIDYE